MTKKVKVTTGRGTSVIEIKRGQFLFGRNTASKELNMPASTIRNIVAYLATGHFLDIKKDSHYSIITICNYEKYQNPDNYKRTGKRTTKGQAKDTNNNVNNDENKRIYADYVLLTDKEYQELIERLGLSECISWIEKLNNYIGSKGKKYKSHYHTILSWQRKNGTPEENNKAYDAAGRELRVL